MLCTTDTYTVSHRVQNQRQKIQETSVAILSKQQRLEFCDSVLQE